MFPFGITCVSLVGKKNEEWEAMTSILLYAIHFSSTKTMLYDFSRDKHESELGDKLFTFRYTLEHSAT